MNETALLRRKDFLSVLDFDADDFERCIDLALRMKADRALGSQAPTAKALESRFVALLFEKPSLRTRTTFEFAVR
jgi:ornithine carbamoyltransferase